MGWGTACITGMAYLEAHVCECLGITWKRAYDAHAYMKINPCSENRFFYFSENTQRIHMSMLAPPTFLKSQKKGSGKITKSGQKKENIYIHAGLRHLDIFSPVLSCSSVIYEYDTRLQKLTNFNLQHYCVSSFCITLKKITKW
ncbi:hypothetical protein POVWA1_034380 [Plasmodium ovale wallikeri]|uniref:Uncharacterized protein n=1 Tax=Plasmodium ovale wallikeri TaxID=864142 RepID=A0A1A8YZ32_PLAOA|nr:hypothetical protein POVWA1_034380 [Plasmodium ovale wallikeri]